MSRIFITGDTHCDYDWEKINTTNFPEQKNLTKDDYVIIAGDFGGIWGLDKTDRYIIKTYEKRSFTTLFVDGNHENHDALDQYPVEIWNGGKIHRISDTVIHLMRGQVFEIGGKSKDGKQIAQTENAYIISDDFDYPLGNKLPMWLFGLMY